MLMTRTSAHPEPSTYAPMSIAAGLDDSDRVFFPSYEEGIQSHSGSGCGLYDDSPLPISQWYSNSLLPDVDPYDQASTCHSSTIKSSSHGNYKHFDDSYNGSSWPYDCSSSYNPSYPDIQDSRLANPTSPSLSETSDSSGSDGVVSPPATFEFANVFDLNFATPLSSEYPTNSSWTTTFPSVGSSIPIKSYVYSPSPSCSSLDGSERKSLSRSSSPLESESSRQRRRFPCLIIGCARRFTSQYTLKVHMEAHKPKPRVTFPCTLGCSEKFSRQHDRLRHEVAKHGKVCEFSCDDCGRFFSTKKTLGNHKCPVAQGGTRWVNS